MVSIAQRKEQNFGLVTGHLLSVETLGKLI